MSLRQTSVMTAASSKQKSPDRDTPHFVPPVSSLTVSMEASYDTLVVGAGYAGSVVAQQLATRGGQRVLVVDRRDHIAGNAFDYYDEHGVRVHKYGPHIFHTKSEKVVDY